MDATFYQEEGTGEDEWDLERAHMDNVKSLGGILVSRQFFERKQDHKSKFQCFVKPEQRRSTPERSQSKQRTGNKDMCLITIIKPTHLS